MPFDYLANFPIPTADLSNRLRRLLEPVGTDPTQVVDVTTRHDPGRNFDDEYVHMIMAVVHNDGSPLPVLSETEDGVVAHSTPVADKAGTIKDLSPAISGHDYIVASWGDSSFYTYSLAEKVWMTLGLSPRCVGNDSQRIIYDDLSLPEFGVAEGEISTEYYWSPKRNVSWRMSNEYLRKYLWMRGAYGVRVFFYQVLQKDQPYLRSLMHGKPHILLEPRGGWYRLDLREHQRGLLIQLWATVHAVSPILCPEQSADGITWPGVAGPMTNARANALVDVTPVFVDDRFLQRYEQNIFYDATPAYVYEQWHCSPNYRNQWGFSSCVRVGRNAIRVPMRELYKPKPDREIIHARSFALTPDQIANIDLGEEHIVAKIGRLLDQLLDLGDHLSALGASVGLAKSASELVGFSRVEANANGWHAYSQLTRLAQVAPLDMSQQAFLSRCKSLHEAWQRVPNAFLKSLLEKAGCPRADVKQLGSLKLLEALLNIVSQLNAHEETIDTYPNTTEPENWQTRNSAMAALFLNNDLRIADAHETFGECLGTLQTLGFDTANLNQGYGRALDFVVDGVVSSFATINTELVSLLMRR